MKEIFAPHLGRKVKFGRKRPRVVGPHLKLRNYLDTSVILPQAPPAVDYSAPAMPILRDVMGNDALGDCVIASGYHIVGVETSGAGAPFHATADQVVADYGAIGGYVSGDPSTDNGCNIQDALNYWMQHGFANGTPLAGYLGIDPTNQAEIMCALYLFENLDFGCELPDAWISPFPSSDGFKWGSGYPCDPNNGHSFPGIGYSGDGVILDTWGLLGFIAWEAIAQNVSPDNGGELYVLLTPDQVNKATQKAPNGFGWADLAVDFQTLGGTPSPGPIPGPAPSPPNVTLDQAIAWAAQGLTENWKS